MEAHHVPIFLGDNDPFHQQLLHQATRILTHQSQDVHLMYLALVVDFCWGFLWRRHGTMVLSPSSHPKLGPNRRSSPTSGRPQPNDVLPISGHHCFHKDESQPPRRWRFSWLLKYEPGSLENPSIVEFLWVVFLWMLAFERPHRRWILYLSPARCEASKIQPIPIFHSAKNGAKSCQILPNL